MLPSNHYSDMVFQIILYMFLMYIQVWGVFLVWWFFVWRGGF